MCVPVHPCTCCSAALQTWVAATCQHTCTSHTMGLIHILLALPGPMVKHKYACWPTHTPPHPPATYHLLLLLQPARPYLPRCLCASIPITPLEMMTLNSQLPPPPPPAPRQQQHHNKPPA
jgi:hypothetical protein